MKKNRFIVIAISVILCSCQSKINLNSDEILCETFSKNELKEIQKMIDYSDSYVKNITNEKDISKAYHSFFENENKTNFGTPPINEKEKYEFLESLDSTLLKDFWTIKTGGKMVRYKDSIYHVDERYKSLQMNTLGRYVNYIINSGQNDILYKELGEVVKAAGGLPASFLIWITKNHNDINFNIPRNRLLATVYVMENEGHSDNKMERYLKQ